VLKAFRKNSPFLFALIIGLCGGMIIDILVQILLFLSGGDMTWQHWIGLIPAIYWIFFIVNKTFNEDGKEV
jgi:hypothetical protein